MDFKNLAKEYDTPTYVYDMDYIEDRFLILKSAFRARKSLICYAVKANSNLSVIKKLASLGAGADCVSIGEIKKALLAGVKKYQIIFSGVGKSKKELQEAIELDVLMINIESDAEYRLIEEIAKEKNITVRISIRVNPNIDPKTHPYISTGLHANKFGVSIDVAKKLYIDAKKNSLIKPVGIHFHIGSQLTDIGPLRDSCLVIAKLLKELLALEIDIKFFDVGGGIGVQYQDETLIDVNEYVKYILEAIKGTDVTIICEPGRFISANSGYLITRVLYEKINGDKRFVIVDGAMNDLLRPSLYGSFHDVVYVGDGDGEKTSCSIVGPVCESGDFFAKDVMLPQTKSGDVIVVKSCGAYGFVMASNYNSRVKPAEVAISKGGFRLIRRRESFDDLVANELQFLDE
jgi:diaminopimelate decarboxylase